eukprot:1360639-Amorphochlora_amoeboformis.AAC.2
MPAKFGANCIGDLEENEPLVHKQQPLADHGFHNLKGGASSTFSDLKVTAFELSTSGGRCFSGMIDA